MTRRGALLPALIFGFAAATAAPAWAQAPRYGRAALEVGGFAGVLDVKAPDGADFDVDQDVVAGGRLGYVSRAGVFVLAEAAFSPQTLVAASGAATDLDALRVGGQLGYAFQPARAVQLLISAGAGAIRWEPEGFESETDFTATFGGGLRLFLGPAVALRLDVRDHFIPDALAETTEALDLGTLGGDEPTHNLEASAGLSVFVGGERDSDRDGVRDGVDRCPATPLGAPVDARGCPLDRDGDRVADHLDRCPETPAGAVVGEDGCPLDTDGDGVFDGLDGCSGTPPGARVDAQGCPTDADMDGIMDGIDRCPDTPSGATVDGEGCPTDADGDGVLDGLDRCPNTPPGTEVDVEGCSRVEAGIEAGRLVLHDVHFDFGKAEIRPDSRTILDEVGRALLDRPGVRIEIQGHTDAIGSDEANLRLSRRRAEAVRTYLLGAFRQLEPDRLDVRGYGESRPIASNATEEGRAQNRRVEFVIVGED